MARFFPLSSGSSGNSVYFGSGAGGILIDAGISARRMTQTLEGAGIDPTKLGGIFLTHEHIDHVNGLRVFAKKYKLTVYGSKGTLAALEEGALVDASTPLVAIDETGVETAGGVIVRPFHTSHDCREGYGYQIDLPDGRTAALATDLGYLSEEVLQAIRGRDLVMIESNHDVRMLENGSYPYPLKRRILSDMGHLSNETCAKVLPELVKSGSTRFALAHLSKENNTPALAYQTSLAELQLQRMRPGIDFELMVAPRETTGNMILF